MKDLVDSRNEINKIDSEMAALFERRMNECKNVVEYKMANSMPIFDGSREEAVINNNLKNIKDDSLKEYYVRFIKSVMEISKSYQSAKLSGLKVAYSGVKGAYGFIAAKHMFPNCELVAMDNFTKAYESVENGTNDRVILPIENSFVGDVGEVMDLLFQGSLYINSIYNLHINHCLIVNDGATLDSIKKVVSHPQALAQCSKFIQEHNFVTEDEVNTAYAGKKLKELGNTDIAVIGSKETAEEYGLNILKENINNTNTNTTRFASLSRVMLNTKNEDVSKKSFIIVFTVKNTAGALAKCLDIIGAYGFNMRNLRSRLMQDLMWTYYFFCEIEGDYDTEEGEEMMTALKVFCDRLKIVGSYVS